MTYTERRGGRTGTVVWRVDADAPERAVHPDGVMDLMWIGDRLTVAGADTRTAVVAMRPGTRVLGLRLPPGTATALLGLPADELTGRRVDLAELLPRGDLPAVDPGSWDSLEDAFIRLWAAADPDRDRLRLAAALDRAARAGLTVIETARRHEVSERTLRRTSHQLFGYGHKTLAQIHRFGRGLDLARAGTPLAEAALLAGYVDQAHFNREAKRLTGHTPAQLRA